MTEDAQQASPSSLLTRSWTQHFAFNSVHMYPGHRAHLRAAATQGPADSPASICHRGDICHMGCHRGPGSPLLLPELGSFYLLP